MFPCPHCGNTINVGPKKRTPWWAVDVGPSFIKFVIVMALFMALFGGIKNVNDSIQSLAERISRLEGKPSVATQPVQAQDLPPQEDVKK